ncbi:MAG: hypothetical protein AAB351_02720 [Patescibacteria group bacterium]
MNQELLDYVTTARAKGSDDAKITEELLITGWSQSDIDQALIVNNPVSQSTVPEASNVNPTSTPETFKERLKDKKFWGSVVVFVLIIAAGAYFYIVYAAGPQTAWNKLSFSNYLASTQNWHKHDLTLKYGYEGNEKKMTANFEMQVDTLYENDTLTVKGNIAAGYSYDGSQYSFSGIEMRFLNNAVYINFKSIPLLSDFVKDYDGWLKVDSKTAKEATGTTADSNLKDQILEILRQNKIVSSHKYLGKEDVLGKKTYHYSLAIDKQALVKSYQQILELDKKSSAKATAEDIKIINNTIAKSEISIDLWLGTSDYEVYRVLANVKMPDFLQAPQKKASDAKVLADIRQLATGLEMYYFDKGYYPDSLNDLTPIYIGAIPKSANNIPECPTKDVYTYVGNKLTYSLKACISTDTGGYTAGVIQSVPDGIRSLEPHPEWSKVDFTNAPLNTSFDFDWKIVPSSPVTVTAPDKYYDASSAISAPGSLQLAPSASVPPIYQFNR